MESFHHTIQSAAHAHSAGYRQAALERYSDAFNILVADAAAFAQSTVALQANTDELRTLTPILLAYAKEYLLRDTTAATVLNEMGVLFGELGDYENAKQKFTEAIAYIPPGISYTEPEEHLHDIASRIIQTIALEEPHE